MKMNVIRKVLSFKDKSDVNEFLMKIHINCFNFEKNRIDEDLVISSIFKYLKECKEQQIIERESIKMSTSQLKESLRTQNQEK